MTDEVVTRLYRCLVEELRRRGHPEDRPVKVADLYQELVPYRAVRSALDVELNADYEHAMLRLLAGERNLLRLEPEAAREELRREVDAPYPFVGMFRKFSASNVFVSMPSGAKPESAPAEPVRRERPAPAPLAPAPVKVAAVAAGGAASPAPMRIERESAAPAPAEHPLHSGVACAFCDESLPTGRRVRFCPYCGGDQRLRPCPKCEAVLEREWRYCIRCGFEPPR